MIVLWIGGDLDDILCEGFERTVGNDNCVRFDNVVLANSIMSGRRFALTAIQMAILQSCTARTSWPSTTASGNY